MLGLAVKTGLEKIESKGAKFGGLEFTAEPSAKVTLEEAPTG
jgi:hypothetical protein